MKKFLMSLLLCMSLFIVFGCSNNAVDEYDNDDENYEEEIDDIDLEESVDEETEEGENEDENEEVEEEVDVEEAAQ